MLPVPTVAPRAVAVAQNALLSLKIFPKVFFKTKPHLKNGKNPLAAVRKNPVPKTSVKRAGPHIISEIFSVLNHRLFLKRYAVFNSMITKKHF